MAWTKEQNEIFSAVADGESNLAIDAAAGSGKTTTAVEAAKLCYGTVGFAAFGKAIATSLQGKLPVGASAGTLHSIGCRMMMRRFGSKVEPYKARNLLRVLRPEWHFESKRSGSLLLIDKWAPVLDLVTVAKQQGLRPSSPEMFGEALRQGVDLVGDDATLGAIWEGAEALYEESMITTGIIDYDDMIAGPRRHGLLGKPSFDTVIIDEAQDLNPAQQFLASALGRRKIVVGDPRQAIMGFAGADSDSFPRMASAFEATVLPLSTCWRCPTGHIREASKLVPRIVAAPSAVEGTIGEMDESQLVRRAQPGHMVICRNNAPLVRLAYRFLKAGRPAAVLGRAIGQGILILIRKLRPKTLPDLAYKLDAWKATQVELIVERKHGDKAAIQAVEDKCECILTLVEASRDLDQVKAAAERLFADSGLEGKVVLSSIHKSKGLEADTVWFYEPGLCPAGPDFQELNLLYVALTRSKSSLFFVDSAVQRRSQFSEWVSKVAEGASRRSLTNLGDKR